MGKIGILQRPDGGITIITPSIEALKHRTIEEIISKANPNNYPVTLVNRNTLPESRLFRNAWEYGTEITVNREKAEQIHMDRLRFLRKKQLESLDTEFLRAVENRNTLEQNRIHLLKTKLRDMPSNELNSLREVELGNLHRFVPDYLNGDIKELDNKVIMREKL